MICPHRTIETGNVENEVSSLNFGAGNEVIVDIILGGKAYAADHFPWKMRKMGFDGE